MHTTTEIWKVKNEYKTTYPTYTIKNGICFVKYTLMDGSQLHVCSHSSSDIAAVHSIDGILCVICKDGRITKHQWTSSFECFDLHGAYFDTSHLSKPHEPLKEIHIKVSPISHQLIPPKRLFEMGFQKTNALHPWDTRTIRWRCDKKDIIVQKFPGFGVKVEHPHSEININEGGLCLIKSKYDGSVIKQHLDDAILQDNILAMLFQVTSSDENKNNVY